MLGPVLHIVLLAVDLLQSQDLSLFLNLGAVIVFLKQLDFFFFLLKVT